MKTTKILNITGTGKLNNNLKNRRKIIFKYFLLIILLHFSQLFPLYPSSSLHLLTLQHPPLSSCPWVVHISSLCCLFLTPFFISPHYFMPTNYTSSLYLPPTIPPYPLPTENPPCDVHFSDSVPVLAVCLVFAFIGFLFFWLHLLILVSLLIFYCA